MEHKPDRKQIIASELRYAFIPQIRDEKEELYIQSPLDWEMPLICFASAMKPNYQSKTRSEMNDEKKKKDLVLRGELVKASDHELWVFMGCVGSTYTTKSEKALMKFEDWCPPDWSHLFKDAGTLRAVLWRGGKDLFFEVCHHFSHVLRLAMRIHRSVLNIVFRFDFQHVDRLETTSESMKEFTSHEKDALLKEYDTHKFMVNHNLYKCIELPHVGSDSNPDMEPIIFPMLNFHNFFNNVIVPSPPKKNEKSTEKSPAKKKNTRSGKGALEVELSSDGDDESSKKTSKKNLTQKEDKEEKQDDDNEEDGGEESNENESEEEEDEKGDDDSKMNTQSEVRLLSARDTCWCP